MRPLLIGRFYKCCVLLLYYYYYYAYFLSKKLETSKDSNAVFKYNGYKSK